MATIILTLLIRTRSYNFKAAQATLKDFQNTMKMARSKEAATLPKVNKGPLYVLGSGSGPDTPSASVLPAGSLYLVSVPSIFLLFAEISPH